MFVYPQNQGIEPKFIALSCSVKMLGALQIWPKTSKSLDLNKFEMHVIRKQSEIKKRKKALYLGA